MDDRILIIIVCRNFVLYKSNGVWLKKGSSNQPTGKLFHEATSYRSKSVLSVMSKFFKKILFTKLLLSSVEPYIRFLFSFLLSSNSVLFQTEIKTNQNIKTSCNLLIFMTEQQYRYLNYVIENRQPPTLGNFQRWWAKGAMTYNS